MRWPKSSTESRAEKLRTNSTSCSTSSTAVPRSLWTARSVSASDSVSWPSRPDDGSSSSSSFGSVISARPTSTSRARPRLSASTGLSATSSSPSSSSVRSVRSFSSEVGFDRLSTSFQNRPVPRRARSATSRWSRTVIPEKSSIRWNVRANPSRARR